MKFEKELKHVLSFPDGEEKEGRLKAIIDLNEGNIYNENRAKHIVDGKRPGWRYWDAYLDTYEVLKEKI